MNSPPRQHARDVHRYLAKLIGAIAISIIAMLIAVVLAWRAWGPASEPEVVPSFQHGQPPKPR